MLRKGFSSGTAVTAATVGALKLLLDEGVRTDKNGRIGDFTVAVFIPFGIYFPVTVSPGRLDRVSGSAVVEVKKDGGDDPDVTHGAVFRVELKILPGYGNVPGIYLKAGEGVGVVTREGLPVRVGEPAVNPVPREMLKDNVENFLLGLKERQLHSLVSRVSGKSQGLSGSVFIPFSRARSVPFNLCITISIPGGEMLAKKTLNPRLGIQGGLSILGTTGLVIPYSHEAYRETIVATLNFARRNGLKSVVFSTGGKSEKLAREQLPELPDAAFIQIADFYRFALEKAQELGFSRVIHSVFFGKLMKMAMGFGYTHAHSSRLDFSEFLKKCECPVQETLAKEIATANTARQVLDILKKGKRWDIIEWIANRALDQSRAFAPGISSPGLMLFDYDGSLLLRRFEG